MLSVVTRYAEYRYAECHVLFIFMLTVMMTKLQYQIYLIRVNKSFLKHRDDIIYI
jgi:hypothetical protein